MGTRSTVLLSLLSSVLCGGALAGQVEGVYAFGPKGGVTIRLSRGEGEGTYVGVLLRAGAERLKGKLGQPVLDLKRGADGALGGRINAAHVGLSDDPTAWLDVTRAEPLPDGDLRCTLRNASGGSAQVLYHRQEPSPPKPAKPDDRDAQSDELAGAWREPDGAVIHYVSHKRRYVGLIDRLSPRLRRQGFRPGEERVRVERVEPGLYRGTLKLRRGQRERWQAVEIAVQGDRLELVLGDKDEGQTARRTAVRLGTTGGAPPAAPAGGADDPGDLTGVWRDRHGGVVRFERVADSRYRATIVRLSPRNAGYGFSVGEIGIKVTRTGRHIYEGKVLARTFGGRSSWWEPIEIAVHKNTLKYTRHPRSGGTEENAAVRIEKGTEP